MLKLDNKTARHLFLHKHGLSKNPATRCSKSDILETITEIGFVQVDSIRTVERAHHLILFSRHQTYKHKMLSDLIEKDRTLFENWTHDASIIPSAFFPFWKHRFEREKIEIVARWEKWGRKGFRQISAEVIDHITTTGPTFSRDLKPPTKHGKSKPGWWDWHPFKSALEFLWRTGETAICHRKGFQKAYDLASNVIPADKLTQDVSTEQFHHWACSSALDRLGFATHGEIAAFWALIKPSVARDWIEQNSDQLTQIEITSFDRKTTKQLWVKTSLLDTLSDIPKPPPRLRILSPFDPMIRDRKRAEFLFGFDYRIEMFVPRAQRVYGYYVFPILQGDKIIGRIDMKADRKSQTLNVRRIWGENKVKWSPARKSSLDSELNRLARFSSLSNLNYGAEAFAGLEH